MYITDESTPRVTHEHCILQLLLSRLDGPGRKQPPEARLVSLPLARSWARESHFERVAPPRQRPPRTSSRTTLGVTPVVGRARRSLRRPRLFGPRGREGQRAQFCACETAACQVVCGAATHGCAASTLRSEPRARHSITPALLLHVRLPIPAMRGPCDWLMLRYTRMQAPPRPLAGSHDAFQQKAQGAHATSSRHASWSAIHPLPLSTSHGMGAASMGAAGTACRRAVLRLSQASSCCARLKCCSQGMLLSTSWSYVLSMTYTLRPCHKIPVLHSRDHSGVWGKGLLLDQVLTKLSIALITPRESIQAAGWI